MSLLSGIKVPSQLHGFALVRACSQGCDSRPPEADRRSQSLACLSLAFKVVNVLVDTSIWSLALRRKAHAAVAERNNLIKEGRARIIGLVRQELLSGIKAASQYEKRRALLRSFPDEPVSTQDYEAAAKAGNECRARGVAVSVSDILICAVAIARDWPVFSSDRDFKSYSGILPLNCTRRGSGLFPSILVASSPRHFSSSLICS